MKVAKRITIGGDWAKPKQDIFDGDIITIKDAGQIIPGDFGDRHTFKVETKNGEKNLSFNQTSMNYLIEGFGDETNDWVGKEVKAHIVKSNVGGKMRDVIYLTPPDWIEGMDGYYPPNEKSLDPDEDIPVIDE